MRYIFNVFAMLMTLCAEMIFAQTLTKDEVLALNKRINDIDYLGDFSCDRAIAVQNGKYGFIDKKGRFVISCTNPNTASYPFPIFESGVFIGKNSIINDKGRVLETLSDFSFFANENEFGGPRYIQKSNNDFEIYKDGRKFGSYNTPHFLYGNILVSVVRTTEINYFGNNNRFYLSNIASKSTTEYEAQYVQPFRQKNGSYLFCIGKNNKMGIIDDNLKEVVPFIFDARCQDDDLGLVNPNIIMYSNGFVLEQVNCEKSYKVKDLSGKQVLQDFYEYINVGSKYIYAQRKRNTLSAALTSVDGFCEVFDKKGNSINELSFGKNYLRMKNGFWQFEDKEGKKLFPYKIDCMSEPLWDEYCIVNRGDNYWLLNSNGDIVVDSLSGVYRDRDVLMTIYDKKNVKNAGIKGISIVDAHSDLVFPANNDRLLNLRYKIRSVDGKYKLYNPDEKQGPYMLLDPDGNNLTPMGCDWIGRFSEGLILVKIKGRLYYINEKGEGLPNEAYMTK
ncbi:MAG: WG repeat-containing protein [Paludibacteraceae bacterium]|nr:WG repeat-containing protein [Paludibacteraceae bacterium]